MGDETGKRGLKMIGSVVYRTAKKLQGVAEAFDVTVNLWRMQKKKLQLETTNPTDSPCGLDMISASTDSDIAAVMPGIARRTLVLPQNPPKVPPRNSSRLAVRLRFGLVANPFLSPSQNTFIVVQYTRRADPSK